MSGITNSVNEQALAAKTKIDNTFLVKGIITATLSGIFYGFYTAFLTLAMAKGVWADWYGPNEAALSAFTVTFMLGSLGSAINDSISGIWCIISASIKGKMGDFFRTLTTKPGRIMILAALVGGPISSTAYVIGLQLAGSIVVPISALCPCIGAILGRILYKQKLNARMMLGIFICLIASFMIGMTAVTDTAREGALLGIFIAFIAAFGWGLEGCVAGYGTSLIDYEIGITIRQCTSGLSNLLVLLPLFAIISGNIGLAPSLLFEAVTSFDAMKFFILSGLFAMPAYSLWYKGNSMCGAALGMACNGMFSFWGPFFCWLIIGVGFGIDGWAIPPIAWLAAVVMVIGIFLIAMNPLDLFKKKGVC